jgi:hypothetical protein
MQKVQKVQKTASAASEMKCGGVSAIAALPAGLVVMQLLLSGPPIIIPPDHGRAAWAAP